MGVFSLGRFSASDDIEVARIRAGWSDASPSVGDGDGDDLVDGDVPTPVDPWEHVPDGGRGLVRSSPARLIDPLALGVAERPVSSADVWPGSSAGRPFSSGDGWPVSSAVPSPASSSSAFPVSPAAGYADPQRGSRIPNSESRPVVSRKSSAPPDPDLQRWIVLRNLLRLVLLLAAAASVVLNSNGAPSDDLVGRAVAGAPPLVLLVCSEILMRIPSTAWYVTTGRLLATLVVGAVAVWQSFIHQSHALVDRGYDLSSSRAIPIMIDGLIVVVGLSLGEIARKTAQLRADAWLYDDVPVSPPPARSAASLNGHDRAAADRGGWR